MNKYFLTGVTGVVGSAVLKKILLDSDCFVYLLIRGNDFRTRLNAVFSYLNLESALFEHRIQVINASIEDKNYKLGNAEFNSLAGSLSGIFHCAASVDLLQNESLALEQSKATMDNLFRLLELNPAIKIEYVSTVGVNGRSTSGLSEDKVSMDRTFFNTYESTKARVEQSIYLKIEEGFNINIHRPSMVVGDQASGRIIHFQIFYFLLRLFAGELTFGLLPPIFHRKLDTIPADFVAEILYLSSQTKTIEQKIIHHCSGPEKSLTFEEIQKIYNSAKAKEGLPQKPIIVLPFQFFNSAATFALRLPIGQKWKTRLDLVPQLLSYAQQDQVFYNSKTQHLFPSIIWPDPKEYLENSIKYYICQRNKLSGEK